LSQLKVHTSLVNMRWHPLYSSSDPIIQNAFQNLNHEGNQTLQQLTSESWIRSSVMEGWKCTETLKTIGA